MGEVIVYENPHKHRSRTVCQAMFAGIRASGDSVRLVSEASYQGPAADVAVFYGLSGNLERIFRDYPAVGKTAVYIDLGYWARRAGGGLGRFRGYHKLGVNSRHPTAYFRKFSHDGTRASRLRLSVAPWRTGRHILVAGMGFKAANAEGLIPEQWERSVIREIALHTKRPIIYRPKPSCHRSGPVGGVQFSPPTQPLEEVFQDCHAVVTHHSNVAVDALLAGIPTFCWEGAATPMSLQDLSKIETPYRPDDRQQWLHDVTWCQFHVDEMAAGIPWRHLKAEGLV